MKKLGIILIVFAIFFMLFQFLFPSLALDGVLWEMIFLLVGVFASLWLPNFPTIKQMKWYWRAALIFSVFSAFLVVWVALLKMLPISLRDYALPITMILFGLIAILFDFLDKRAE